MLDASAGLVWTWQRGVLHRLMALAASAILVRQCWRFIRTRIPCGNINEYLCEPGRGQLVQLLFGSCERP